MRPAAAGALLAAGVAAAAAPALAQMHDMGQAPLAGPAAEAAPFGAPVDDRHVYVHGLLSELEGRFGATDAFRWEGEGWIGGDGDRLWIKTEGETARGRVSDGQQEVYWSHPVSTYFDVQLGGRYDLDSGPGRGWAAAGVEGLAPFFFHVGAHAYLSDGGRAALKLEGSNAIRFSQRLILEPQLELNLYAQSDPARDVGAGLSDLDAGLRLRYEISRKFAPYVGLTYQAPLAHRPRENEPGDDDLRLTAGVRGWF